ncbi:hypothetical protein HRI_002979200 [Hibiscus trionum]|uniref:Secreted protein n=1 Tax=Hibiscus trionum TaxID=183268 RepID=A0A9W7IBR5_HIBTR|nr:hypothetical protein HRI_002979200 [Hibiscus trionum]
MASSSLASPLCTWLVAACVSVTSENDQSRSLLLSGLTSSNTRLGRWARNKKKALFFKCCGDRIATNKDADLISSFRGSMTSCLAFEPCNEYYFGKLFFFFIKMEVCLLSLAPEMSPSIKIASKEDSIEKLLVLVIFSFLIF